jgi:DNA-binding NarL/FixJ family response regulator
MWHTEVMVTEDELRAARKAHDEAVTEATRIREEADRKRAEIVVRALGEGMPQKDIIEAMGYSRETVRRITLAAKES